jgi:hypothetical protein
MEKTESVLRRHQKRLNTPQTLGGEGESPTPQTIFPSVQPEEAGFREGEPAFSISKGGVSDALDASRAETLDGFSRFYSTDRTDRTEQPDPHYDEPNTYEAEGKSPLSPKVLPPVPLYLEYTANLDQNAPVALYPSRVTTCTPKYIVQACSCGRSIIPSTCMSLSCRTCAPWTNKRRARSLFGRLTDPSGTVARPVIYTVFTVPQEIRHKFIDAKEWQKVRKKVWTHLKDTHGASFGVEVSHPKGDEGNQFHPHLNFLWRTRKGFRPFVDTSLLRTAWADILGVSSVDVHSEYTEHPAKIMHWCKYITRVFLGFHKWAGAVRWYGHYPRTSKKIACTCGLCGEPFRAVGTVRADDVDNWYKHGWKLGLEPPWYNNKKIMHFKSKRV